MGLRAFQYQRVSEDRQFGRSVAEQQTENKRVIERNGWETVESFTDNDRSASRYATKSRPRWEDMLVRLRRGEADVLVTWEASRSTRDLEVYVELRRVCRETRTKWCYNGNLYDLEDGDDSFRTGLDILLAEKEADQTRKRVMRSMRSNAETGRPHGKLLEGYVRQYDGTGQFIAQVIYEPEAEVIREIFARFLAGISMYETWKYYKAGNVLTKRGSEWITTQQKRVLTNPGYIGKRVHQGKVVGEALWPAIVSEADFYQVQAKFADPERKARYRRETAVKYLLTSIARCGVCGGKVITNKPRGYPSYTCKDNFCFARKIFAVDELITGLVIARLKRPDVLSLLAQDDTGVNEAINEVADLEARLESFINKAADGEISADVLARVEAKLRPQIDAADRKTRRVGAPTVLYDLTNDPEVIWPELSIAQQREVLATLMRVTIHRSRQGERTFNPASVTVDWL